MFPWTLLAITTVPAIVNVGIGYAIRNDPFEIPDFEFITYREYVGVSTALLLFVALTAPDVMCPDRAQRVLPLIFSRPLTGSTTWPPRWGPSPPSCSASRSCPRSCCSSARCW